MFYLLCGNQDFSSGGNRKSNHEHNTTNIHRSTNQHFFYNLLVTDKDVIAPSVSVKW